MAVIIKVLKPIREISIDMIYRYFVKKKKKERMKRKEELFYIFGEGRKVDR